MVKLKSVVKSKETSPTNTTYINKTKLYSKLKLLIRNKTFYITILTNKDSRTISRHQLRTRTPSLMDQT